nr:hypothetical protein [Escherichia coli]
MSNVPGWIGSSAVSETGQRWMSAARIGLAQIADVMPQVSAAMDKAQGNISSGDTVRIIFGVATILVAAFIAWSQVRKHQKGLV